MGRHYRRLVSSFSCIPLLKACIWIHRDSSTGEHYSKSSVYKHATTRYIQLYPWNPNIPHTFSLFDRLVFAAPVVNPVRDELYKKSGRYHAVVHVKTLPRYALWSECDDFSKFRCFKGLSKGVFSRTSGRQMQTERAGIWRKHAFTSISHERWQVKSHQQQ